MPRRPVPAPTPPPASRRALQVALALALAGIAVALWLVRLHFRAHAGYASFCAINEVFNCDRVATSRYSVVLGIPVAAWGVVGFATAAVLAALGLRRSRPHGAWPAGLLVLAASAAVAASIALAVVSEVLIGAFCIMCALTWAIALALAVAAFAAARPRGVSAAIRADLAVLRARPGATAAVAVAGIAALAILSQAYPRYWAKAPPVAAAPAPAARPGPSAGAPAAATDAAGRRVVYEFSDYECPFCAQAHSQLRAQLAGRDDLQVVHRQFPLDQDCNPLLKRQMHAGACVLARAGICAERQGRGARMDDLLFANQQARRPLDELVREVGLDPGAFQACLGSADTERRLAADIAEGIRVGIRVTPSYVVDGVVHPGQLPPALLAGETAPATR